MLQRCVNGHGHGQDWCQNKDSLCRVALFQINHKVYRVIGELNDCSAATEGLVDEPTMQDSYIGNTSAFQADEVGSTPTFCSNHSKRKFDFF